MFGKSNREKNPRKKSQQRKWKKFVESKREIIKNQRRKFFSNVVGSKIKAGCKMKMINR